MSTGESIPCSAEKVTIELMGEAAEYVDQELIKNAAETVLHYFKSDLKCVSVSVTEFATALEKVLRGLGLDVKAADTEPEPDTAPEAEPAPTQIAEADLAELAFRSARGFELSFFAQLREEFARKLEQEPRVLRFSGLRVCVKHLVGAKRWSGRCERLADQIVDYLRQCLRQREGTCALLITS